MSKQIDILESLKIHRINEFKTSNTDVKKLSDALNTPKEEEEKPSPVFPEIVERILNKLEGKGAYKDFKNEYGENALDITYNNSRGWFIRIMWRDTGDDRIEAYLIKPNLPANFLMAGRKGNTTDFIRRLILTIKSYED